MEFTAVMLINFFKLLVAPVVVLLCLKNKSAFIMVGAVAVIDVVLFWQDLFYYESLWMFLLLIILQLLSFIYVVHKLKKKEQSIKLVK